MNYPFLYQELRKFPELTIRRSDTPKKMTVWDDWTIESVDCPEVKQWIEETMPFMACSTIYISEATSSNWHIDRFYFYMIKHRVVIPLTGEFHYEWSVRGKTTTLVPEKRTAYLLNNMVPHRFVNRGDGLRTTLMIDMMDERLHEQLPTEFFQRKCNVENGVLEKEGPPTR